MERTATNVGLYGELVGHVKANRALFVVGTGVSRSATADAPTASWTGLIKDGLRYCKALDPMLPDGWTEAKAAELDAAAKRGDLHDLIGVATTVERRLGGRHRRAGDWRNWLRQTIGNLKVQDGRLVAVLHDLGRGRLATCNYDDVLTSNTYPPVPWTNVADSIRVLTSEDHGVVHLHGHWRTPESVVLGYDSYAAVLKDEAAQSLQRSLASLSSLVFVGFGAGLEDPNFGALLDWMADTFSEREAHHFRLVRDDEVRRAQGVMQKARVVMLGYGSTYDDLERFLRRLAAEAGVPENAGSSAPPHLNPP